LGYNIPTRTTSLRSSISGKKKKGRPNASAIVGFG